MSSFQLLIDVDLEAPSPKRPHVLSHLRLMPLTPSANPDLTKTIPDKGTFSVLASEPPSSALSHPPVPLSHPPKLLIRMSPSLDFPPQPVAVCLSAYICIRCVCARVHAHARACVRECMRVHPLACKLPEDHGPCLAFLCVPSAWHRASAANHVSSIYLNLRLGRLEVIPLDSRLPALMRAPKPGEEETERKERDPSSAPSPSAATLPSQGFPFLAWPGPTSWRRRGVESNQTHITGLCS